MSPTSKRAAKRAQGTCGVHGCTRPLAPGAGSCKEHLEQEAQRARERPRKRSQFCTACGQRGHNARNRAFHPEGA